ncbi:hypothetical protein [Lactiplantibacillus paraxiangfangensis]|uniref:hypothetical protein n=1 Tax=Lactiplantibacillus paraxiangfangensis TaxID=3076224 RepID=UPI0030C7830B
MVEIFGKDVFNSEFKKDAQNALERDVDKYNDACSNLNSQLEYLQECRNNLSESLRQTESLVDNLKNTPAGFHDKVQTLKINLQSYQKLLETAKRESAKIVKGAGAGAAGGVAAGTAVAVFGGSALTALAMSVGTASTGTAIAGLSGAVATNAALAWLGGGAIAAGGSGIAGGEAVLGMLGPIGVAIGGLTLVTTGVLANGKNKKAAAEMYSNAAKVEAGIKATKALTVEAGRQSTVTVRSTDDLKARVQRASNTWPDDFLKFTDDQALEAGALVNNALSAEKVLNARLGKSGKFEKPTELEKTNFGKPEVTPDKKIIGKIVSVQAGIGIIETVAGEGYSFRMKKVSESYQVGDDITFAADGDQAKDISRYTPDLEENEKKPINQPVTNSSKGTTVGKVISFANGQGTILTNNGATYRFRAFNTYGSVGLNSIVTFSESGNEAKDIYETDESDYHLDEVNNQHAQSMGSGQLIGRIMKLADNEGTIFTESGDSYPFKVFNTYGNIGLNSTVTFTAANGVAKDIREATE